MTDEKIPLKDNSDSIHSTGDHQHRRQIAVKYLYTVKEGVSSEQQYGLRLAAVAGFPEDILQRAEEISNQVKRSNEDYCSVQGKDIYLNVEYFFYPVWSFKMNDRVRELKKDQAELLQQMKNEAELVKVCKREIEQE